MAKITRDQAINIGNALSVDWSKYRLDQFVVGINVEMEHERTVRRVGGTDPQLVAGMIAIDHLSEYPDYYDRLKKVET